MLFVEQRNRRQPILHRHVDVQAKNLFLVLIEHLALDAVNASGGLVVEDGLLNDGHLTSGGRAGQTVDVDLSAVQRKTDGGVLAKVALLGEHLQSLVRGSEGPSSRSDVLVKDTIAVDGGVLAGDDGVVDDLNGIHDSVSLLAGADGPGDGTRGSHDSLDLKGVDSPYSEDDESKNELHVNSRVKEIVVKVKTEKKGSPNRVGRGVSPSFYSMVLS